MPTERKREEKTLQKVVFFTKSGEIRKVRLLQSFNEMNLIASLLLPQVNFWTREQASHTVSSEQRSEESKKA